jgi:ABC-type bacteriocin/lantibiotic exporter with double-glycine peptidase domain
MEHSPYLSPLKRFWRLLKPDNREITFLYVYAFFIGIVQLSLPLGIQSIINLIQGGQMSTSLIILILFVIIGVIVSGALHLNQLRITENLQQKIFVRAAFEFAYRIPKIKLEALYKHYSPELMNRFFDIVVDSKGLVKNFIGFFYGLNSDHFWTPPTFALPSIFYCFQPNPHYSNLFDF